jgi:hypothetical protein
MADITNQDKIKAAKKSLDEAQKLYTELEVQYNKAETLYNKAKAAVAAAEALATQLTSGAAVGTALALLPDAARAVEAAKRKGEAKKLQKKAEQERSKIRKAYDAAKKRIITIRQQLKILITKRSLKDKTQAKKRRSTARIKTQKAKIKRNKAQLKAGLKKAIKAVGPIAITLAIGAVLNNQINKLAQTVYQLGVLVDKTNDIIRAANTTQDLAKARIARDAALASLASAEVQVANFRETIKTISNTINILTLLIAILTALPYTPYQLSPLGIRTTRTITKYTPILISLGILLQVSLNTLDGLLSTIQYERERLLPLNQVLENEDLSPEEVRDLLDVAATGLGPVPGVIYNNFTFSIIEEDDPNFVVAGNKRRYAVALDRSGFIVLQSTPSFTLDPNVLVEELKLEIDKQNLEA